MEQHQHPQVSPAELPRRSFLKWAMGVLSGFGAILVGWPLIASLIGPSSRRTSEQFVKVAALDDLPVGEPVKVTFPYASEDAFLHEEKTRDIWVIRRSDGQVTAFSPICPHLSCRLAWSAQPGQFVCPCHGSVFSLDGRVLAGPAPRPLDTLPVRVEQGALYVKWERFQPGLARKIVV